MTISKEKQVVLPVWLISVLVSVIITGISTWGIISAKAATLELRATHNEANIKALQDTKASRDEIKIIIDQLNRIETKIDEHTKK